jgi:hypothetical protein
MYHKNRVWCIFDEPDLSKIVEKLVENTWTACTAFRWNGLLLFNDSTGPDGAQEYAVVRERDARQIESLTVSWMDPLILKAVLLALALDPTRAEDMGAVTYSTHARGESCGACA